jgi:hypothetical protein
MWPGTVSTVKAYHKGPEFRKHDFQRVRDAVGATRATFVQAIADRMIRVEVGLRKRGIERDFCWPWYVDDSPRLAWHALGRTWEHEVSRIMREGQSDYETVRRARDVRSRLVSVYGDRLGRVLYGTWLEFSAHGERVAVEGLARATFYRHRAQLAAAGCGWVGSDVTTSAVSLIPAGFSPSLFSDRRCDSMAPEVAVALAGLEVAA